MRDLQKMINEGQQIIEKHPQRCISPLELHTMGQEADKDFYKALTDIYFMGVATGRRIAKQEAKQING
jgi:hypothetical protein